MSTSYTMGQILIKICKNVLWGSATKIAKTNLIHKNMATRECALLQQKKTLKKSSEKLMIRIIVICQEWPLGDILLK